MDFELNDQQEELVAMAVAWWKTNYKQTFEISGPAGSGKTSVVSRMIEEAGINPEDVLFMAYVGKAALMLSLRGNNAKTIHSSIYDVVQIPRLDEDGKLMMKNGRVMTMTGFKLKEQLPPNIKLIVVDEGSMPNTPIGMDILSFGLPVIVLGDLNQLPPVFGNPFFLNNPDYILTKVMRQKENDPIIKLSQMAIRGEKIPFGKFGDMCFHIPLNSVKEDKLQELMKAADVIICGKNETRQNINEYYRKQILGLNALDFPVFGDKIICRQNNWKLQIDNGIYLINGLIGYIDNLYLDTYNKKTMNIDFRPEFLPNSAFQNLEMDYKYLFKALTEKDVRSRFDKGNKFQFAYAITAHLAQGSQYNKVLVINEKMGSREYYNKWLYTAITRAVSGLLLAS